MNEKVLGALGRVRRTYYEKRRIGTSYEVT